MQEVGETQKAAEQHYRGMILEKLAKLSPKQQTTFWKFCDARTGSKFVIRREDFDWAADLIERTIRKNEQDPSRLEQKTP